jgi:phenylpyruvate tautomerase PptA (4-oxalocrotonate tautomerase family)
MPLIDLTYPAGALGSDARGTLAERLTTALLRAEGAPDTPFFRGITWCHVHELPPDAVLAGARPAAEPTFKVDVTTPQGALSDREREQLVADATALVCDAAGLGEDEALRVWVLCHEVPEGSWGAGGRVIAIERLKAIAREQQGVPAA